MELHGRHCDDALPQEHPNHLAPKIIWFDFGVDQGSKHPENVVEKHE